jgi:hypothetical protein
MKGRIGVSTEHIASPAIGQDSIQLQQGLVRRNEQVGVGLDCACRVERVSGADAARLKFELLKLEADGCGCKIEHRDLEEINHRACTWSVIDLATGITNRSAWEKPFADCLSCLSVLHPRRYPPAFAHAGLPS